MNITILTIEAATVLFHINSELLVRAQMTDKAPRPNTAQTPNFRRLVRCNCHTCSTSTNASKLGAQMKTNHGQGKRDDDCVRNDVGYRESIVQHGRIYAMLFLDDGACPVRGKVTSTDEDDREEECDSPARDEKEHRQCDPIKYWSCSFGKDTSVQENEAGFYETQCRYLQDFDRPERLSK